MITQYQARNVVSISLAFFFIFFGFGTAQQYLVILFNNQGRGHLALVSLFLLYGVFLVTGIFISRLVPLLGGLKRSLILGAVTYVLFVASVAYDNTPILLIVSVVMGIGSASLWVCSEQIIADSSDKRNVGRNLAFQMIGLYSGNIAGIYAGGYMVNIFTHQNMYAFLVGTICIGVLILFWTRTIKEELNLHPFRPEHISNPRMILLFPLVFATYFLLAQAFAGINLLTVSLLGIGSIPLVVTIFKLSNIIGSFGSGALAGRFSKSILLISLTFVTLGGVLLFMNAYTLVPFLAATAIVGLTTASTYPVTLAWLKETLPSEEYMYSLGTFHVYSNLGVLAALGANLFLSAKASFVPGVLALLIALPCIYRFNKLQTSR
ncbi:MAG: MFS transporter [bacterium]|nr:MFS transporter [bacterium]